MAIPRRVLNQGLAVIGLIVAFLVMASIFVPKKLSAHEDQDAFWAAQSTEAIEGARSLGRVEGRQYTVEIVTSPAGPLYTVYDRDGRLLAERLTAEQVAEQFEGLPLPAIRADVDANIDHAAGPDW